MQYFVRSAVLNGYVELVLELGQDPSSLMRTAGIDPAAVAAMGGWLPAEAVNRLFDLSAAGTGCEHFGLRLAAARAMSNLGPVALVAREEPDVRSALSVVVRHVNLHNEALQARLIEKNGLATVEVAAASGIHLGRQSAEIAVTVIYGLLREFLHDDWQPLTVCFTHDAPADLEIHHRVLGPEVQFGHTFNGIVLYARDLDAANAMSDPLLRPYTRQYLESLLPRQSTPTTTDRVRSMIESLLPTGRCSSTYVARSLDMDRRTLHRHLTRSGETFTSLVDSVRIDLARRYVARHDRTLTEIAEELGFSALSSFSRWFSDRFGCSPKTWTPVESTSPTGRHLLAGAHQPLRPLPGADLA
ncbi:AraC family transcriptional regulator [Nocardia sp. CA-107356]|uniref:AraC family transcriptional regulator n=1 Tax=Nocardia sp. CA-107356 TaxID=3239972 RepID=UPI003D8A16F6